MRFGADMIEFKDTESFWLGFGLTESDGVTPMAVPDEVIFQIYDLNDVLLCEPDVQITNKNNGQFVVTTTDAIPVGKYRVDLLFVADGETVATETFQIKITKGYSRR